MHTHGLQEFEAAVGCPWLAGKPPPWHSLAPHREITGRARARKKKWVKFNNWRMKKEKAMQRRSLTTSHQQIDAQPVPEQWLLWTITPPQFPPHFMPRMMSYGMVYHKKNQHRAQKANGLLEAMQSVDAWARSADSFPMSCPSKPRSRCAKCSTLSPKIGFSFSAKLSSELDQMLGKRVQK